MFARLVTFSLKPGESAGYARTMEQEAIPMLRKCAGFRDEIAMVSSDGKQGVAISFWERREDADAYARDVFPDLTKRMQKHMDGAPVVVTCDVTNSTVHAITALKAGG